LLVHSWGGISLGGFSDAHILSLIWPEGYGEEGFRRASSVLNARIKEKK